jgi:NAD(P)-dependent dehydrogenase (short-subunit alcohol dehydrogenase family)
MLPKGALQDRVAIVTGGGTGIGQEISKILSRLGAKVVVASRRREVVQAAARDIEEAGGEALGIPVDVRSPEQVNHLVERTKERFGRIDILVNNAAGNFRVRAEEMSVNAWRAVIDIVLNGTWYCTQATGREMIASGGGVILNIGSTQAFHGGPLTVHSASAKGGVLAMTRTLAVEWAPYNIRINILTPGPTEDTGAMTQLFADDAAREMGARRVPLGRFARREEIANAAAYLVSDYAGFITGENLVIDGGRWLGQDFFENPLQGHEEQSSRVSQGTADLS